jgi:hypothetical protein
MNVSLDIIFKVAEILFLVGFYYGVIKTKLDNIETNKARSNQIVNDKLKGIDTKIDQIIEKQYNSLVREGQQPILLAAVNEKLEQHTDRLDIHDEAIKNIEITLAARPPRRL